MKLIKKFKEWNPSNLATILILLLPFCYFAFTKFKLNNDFWFLINTGKTILDKGFIKIEPFTIHENLFFIPQQWLTDIIFYIIYNKFNDIGILLLELIVNGVIIFLLYKSSFLISKKRSISIYITLIVDFLFLISDIITSRPQIFDIVLFLLELFLLESFIQKKKKIHLYFIPIISLFLINLHASMWIMFFVFLIPYYVEYFINRIRKKESFKLKPILIITFISILVGFLNPYKIDAITYFFNSYGIKEIDNMVLEMMPVNIKGGILIYVVIFIGFLFIYKNKGNNKIRYILLFLGTTYLTLSHYKGFLFYLVVCPISLSYLMEDKKLRKVKLNAFEKIIYSILIVLLVLFISFNIKIDSDNSLKQIADYLDQNASDNIKLFTGYNSGSYLEYRGYRCYLDPRAEVFLKKNNKKEDIFIEYYDLMSGDLDVNEFLNKYNFDYMLIESFELPLLIEMKNNLNYEELLEVNDSSIDVTYYLYRRVDEKDN